MELAVGLLTVWRSALLIQDALNLILLSVVCWLFCFVFFFFKSSSLVVNYFCLSAVLSTG